MSAGVTSAAAVQPGVGTATGVSVPLATARVRTVDVFPLRIPLRTPLHIAVGGQRRDVELVIVRITTDDGVIGLGETQAWRRRGSNETLKGLVQAIEDFLVPGLLGRSAFDIAAIAADFDRALDGRAYAKAPLLDALLDVQARSLGVPVYQLLGGRSRASVAAGAVLTMRDDLGQTVDEALAFRARGFASITVKVGRELKRDVATVAAVREALGNDARLFVDANASLDFIAASQLLRGLEPHGVEAAEQPLAAWDGAGLAELARRSSIPLILDESVATAQDLLQAVARGDIHAVQTKTAKNGGLWHIRHLWELARTAGWRIRPGNHPAATLATLSVAHLATAWSGDLLEGPFASGIDGELDGDVVTEPLRLQGNQIVLGHAPGWGVELDPEQLQRWRA